jgi:alanyl-tRNA synthetase
VLRLVDVVVRVMGDVFPELRQHKAKIEEIIKEEEESFGKTLAKVNLSF